VIGDKHDFEALCRQERFEDVAHDIDRCFLVGLNLLPDDGVLEHAELVTVKLARRLN